MIDIAKVKNFLEKLAGRIESFDDRAADRLRALGDAVEGIAPAEAWAVSDVHKMINPDLIAEEYRTQKGSGGGNGLVQVMELLRNVFIFVPIIVTWLGVSQASNAYQELLSQCLTKCPDQVSQPFLYLWEQGFGGRLPSILILSNIGWIDAGLLIFIFTLTFLVMLLSHAENRRREAEAQQREAEARQLHAELVHAISQAVLCLYRKPVPLVGPTDNLDDVARRIEVMAQNILDTFNTLANTISGQFEDVTKKMGRQFTDLVGQFDDVAVQIGNRFDGVAGRFEQVASDLTTQVANIEQEFARQLQESNKHLDALGQLMGSSSQLASELQTNAAALQQMSSELSQHLDLLIGPVKDLAQQQQGLLDATTQSATKLDEAANKLGGIDAQMQQWMPRFLDTIEALDISIGRVDAIVSSMGDVNREQKAFLTELQQERGEQERLSGRLADATLGVKGALDAMNEGAVAMRSMAVDMNDVLRLQAAMSDAKQMDVSGIVNGYSSAAQTITKSGHDLSDAAMIIYNAALALKNVASELESRMSTIE